MQERLTWWQGLLVFSSVTATGLAVWSVLRGREAAEKALASLKGPPPERVCGPLVSAIIPTWNEVDFLPDLLTSLSNQTYEPLEFIIADWNSTDGTREVAASLGAKVVDVPERGVGPARNVGAAAASSDFLLFVDADCVLEPTLVEDLMVELLARDALMAHPRIGHYEGGIQRFTGSLWALVMPKDYTSRCVLVRRDAFEAVGQYKNVWREDLLLGKEIKDLFGDEAIAYLPWAICATSTRRGAAVQAGRVPATRATTFGGWPGVEFPAVRDHIYYGPESCGP